MACNTLPRSLIVTLQARTAVIAPPLRSLLSVLVAAHGQDGAAERTDAGDVFQAPAALALGRDARGLRADAGGADDNAGHLRSEHSGG